MPKLKTHKGMKKRFKISATGKVSHKRCGSSHLMSHKSGKRVRRLRKSTTLKVAAEAHRIRNAMLEKQNVNPVHVVDLEARGHGGTRREAANPPESPARRAATDDLIAWRSRCVVAPATSLRGRLSGRPSVPVCRSCSFLFCQCRFSTVESETVNACQKWISQEQA